MWARRGASSFSGPTRIEVVDPDTECCGTVRLAEGEGAFRSNWPDIAFEHDAPIGLKRGEPHPRLCNLAAPPMTEREHRARPSRALGLLDDGLDLWLARVFVQLEEVAVGRFHGPRNDYRGLHLGHGIPPSARRRVDVGA